MTVRGEGGPRVTARAKRGKWRRSAVWRTGIALSVTAIFALPLYIALVNVFKENEQILANPAGIPEPFTLGNLARVLDGSGPDYWLNLLNSFVIVVPSLVGTIVLGSTVGYYIGRSNTRAAQLLQGGLLIGLILPFQVLLLPVSQVLRSVELQGTHIGLIAFNVAFYLPFAAFVYARFIKTVPFELEEAAALDGASPVRTFVQIVVPLLRPTTASVMIFVGVWVWNDFLNPLVLLGPGAGATVTTGIYLAIGQYSTDFGTMFALTLMAALPLLVFFFVLQDRFVAGLTAGATKG